MRVIGAAIAAYGLLLLVAARPVARFLSLYRSPSLLSLNGSMRAGAAEMAQRRRTVRLIGLAVAALGAGLAVYAW
jgi:hydrogenase/urease accessory protein HupE